MALINVRSLVNKTFLLNYLFTTHSLDFMFITETWIKVGDLSPFCDLVPAGCTFFNLPHSSGRGGGLAVILKNCFSIHCHSVPSAVYSSFEVQLLRLEWNDPVLLALVYRPPHLVKDFISEFTAFVGDCITKYNNILLLGDLCLSLSLEQFLPDLDAEQHLSLFNSACSEVLNTTAPLKPKSKPKTEPWLSDNIRSLRQACRRAEQKWKKDKLHFSYEMLKDCLANFQKAVKSAKSKYFSNLIARIIIAPKAYFLF